jgi:lactoylglutathione lyase
MCIKISTKEENPVMSASQPVATFETGHIGLTVSSVSRSSQFYQQVFGFNVLMQSQAEGQQYAFLGHDSKIVLTLWQQGSGKYTKSVPGLHHLSFQVNSMEDVQQVEQKLRAMKVNFLHDGIVSHAEGMQSGGIYFEDPDGIRLEIYSPTGAEDYHADGLSCGLF